MRFIYITLIFLILIQGCSGEGEKAGKKQVNEPSNGDGITKNSNSERKQQDIEDKNDEAVNDKDKNDKNKNDKDKDNKDKDDKDKDEEIVFINNKPQSEKELDLSILENALKKSHPSRNIEVVRKAGATSIGHGHEKITILDYVNSNLKNNQTRIDDSLLNYQKDNNIKQNEYYEIIKKVLETQKDTQDASKEKLFATRVKIFFYFLKKPEIIKNMTKTLDTILHYLLFSGSNTTQKKSEIPFKTIRAAFKKDKLHEDDIATLIKSENFMDIMTQAIIKDLQEEKLYDQLMERLGTRATSIKSKALIYQEYNKQPNLTEEELNKYDIRKYFYKDLQQQIHILIQVFTQIFTVNAKPKIDVIELQLKAAAISVYDPKNKKDQLDLFNKLVTTATNQLKARAKRKEKKNDVFKIPENVKANIVNMKIIIALNHVLFFYKNNESKTFPKDNVRKLLVQIFNTFLFDKNPYDYFSNEYGKLQLLLNTFEINLGKSLGNKINSEIEEEANNIISEARKYINQLDTYMLIKETYTKESSEYEESEENKHKTYTTYIKDSLTSLLNVLNKHGLFTGITADEFVKMLSEDIKNYKGKSKYQEKEQEIIKAVSESLIEVREMRATRGNSICEKVHELIGLKTLNALARKTPHEPKEHDCSEKI